MGSKGGQPTTTTQSQTATYAPSAQAAGYITNAMDKATGAASNPFAIPQAPVAGFSADQMQAFQQYRDAQGTAQPYYNQAASYFSPQGAQDFLNPYAANVMAGMKDVFGAQQSQLNSNLVGAAGGVGADRIGVGQAELGKQQSLAAGQTLSGMYGQAVSQAQAAGAGQMALGQNAQNSAFQGANALIGTGGLQQQLSQAQMNSPYQQQIAQAAFPYQQAQFLAGITGALAPGLGGTTNSYGTGTSTPPAPSMLSQILGGGAAIAGGLGASGAFGEGGWMNGMGNAAYGGNGVWGGSSQNPLPGLDASDYGDGYARGGDVNPYAEGGGVPTDPIDISQQSLIPNVQLQPIQAHIPQANLNLNPPQQSGGGGGDSSLGDIAKIASTAATFLPMLSDERLKENVRQVGKTRDGQDIYTYNFKGSPRTEMGLMAQEVEQRHPEAVGEAGGYKTVDYDEATKGSHRADGGRVNPYAALTGYDDGGGVAPYPGTDDNMFFASAPGERMIRAKRSLRDRFLENEQSRTPLWSGHDLEISRRKASNIADDIRGQGRRLFAEGGATLDDMTRRGRTALERDRDDSTRFAARVNAGREPASMSRGDVVDFLRKPLNPYAEGGLVDVFGDDNRARGYDLLRQGVGTRAPDSIPGGEPPPVINPDEPYRLAGPAAMDAWRNDTPVNPAAFDGSSDAPPPPRARMTASATPPASAMAFAGPDAEPESPALGAITSAFGPPGARNTKIAADTTQDVSPYSQGSAGPPKREPGFLDSPWAALMSAGLGMMAGTSPYAGVNIGQGAMQGVKTLQAQRENAQKDETIAQAARRLELEAKHHEDQYSRLTAGQKQAADLARLPYEQLTKAQQAERDLAERKFKLEAQKPVQIGVDDYGSAIMVKRNPETGEYELIDKSTGKTKVPGSPDASADPDDPAALPKNAMPTQGVLPNGTTGEIAPAPTAVPEALEALKPADARTVRAIAEGRQRFLPLQRNNPYNRKIMEAVHEYDPAVDEGAYSRRVRTQTNFSAGVEARNVTAMNTFGQHAIKLLKLANELKMGQYPSWNAMKNAWAREGLSDKDIQDRLGDWEVVSKAVADEGAKVFAGTNSALADRESWEGKFNVNSPASVTRSKLKEVVELVEGRLNALTEQYNTGMRTSHKPANMIAPQTLDVFEQIKAAAAKKKAGATAPPPPAATAPPPAATAPAPIRQQFQQGWGISYDGGKTWQPE